MKINIIGAGNLGRTIGYLFNRFDVFEIGEVLNRSYDSARKACEFMGAGHPVSRIDEIEACDIWMLSVSDNSIKDLLIPIYPYIPSNDYHCIP